ncbi:MAG: heme o synthase [Bacteroidota bacterium]
MKDSVAVSPSKFKTYLVFIKFRLSFLVILSAISGYLFAGGANITELVYLIIGGILVTGASNGANQIWEQNLDKLMNRTSRRPLPLGLMSNREAYAIVIISLVVGIVLLYLINIYSALLGLFAFVSYVFIYTPLKQVSPWAVFVGAFPGAIPPFLGAIAATNDFGLLPGVLFFVQFTWQFPHFWAIAWILHEDYQRAGFYLLPSKSGKSKFSAFQIMVYSLALIPFSLIPWLMGWCGNITLIVASALGILFFVYSYRLYATLDDKDARKLMFASFVYLPIIQFVYVFDKVEQIIPK